MKKIQEFLKNSIITLLFVAAATILGTCFRHWGVDDTNIVILYLLSVLFCARFTKGYLYGLTATLLSFLLFNWFFTEPYYSLKINDPTYIITVIIMTITATITSALTAKVKQQALEAMERETESNALYQMTSHLSDAEDQEQIASIIVSTISRILGCNAALVCCDEAGAPMGYFIQQRDDGKQVHRELENPVELQKRMNSLHTSCDMGPEFSDFPVYGRDMMLAVLRLPSDCVADLTDAQTRLLHSIIENASLALDRQRSLVEQSRIRDEAAQERYRSNLLRAISHDLRTPLSGIMGTSEMLMGMTEQEDPRFQMSRDIYEDADWLHNLVENILNLTKFQEGHLTLQKETEVAEEVIGAALMVIDKRYPGREISVNIPEELLLVPMDARLIQQVLVNLLDNAANHSPAGRDIAVGLQEKDGCAYFTVADRGTGIPEEALSKIFQMFYTTTHHETTGKRGIGLGLSICQSIVEAHGGKIWAENRPEGGALFTFTLPLGGETK